jgi:hypothetical protein
VLTVSGLIRSAAITDPGDNVGSRAQPPLQRTAKNLFLRPLHFACVSALSIIETVQMQKAMHDVQLKFARERIPEGASVPSRSLDADKNFAVLERQHVRRPRLIEKLSMQCSHSPIGNEQHKNLAQLR